MLSIRAVLLASLCALCAAKSTTTTSSGKATTGSTGPTSTQASATKTSSAGAATITGSGGSGGGSGNETGIVSGPPDVLLRVPTLSVGRIELDVDNLQADINLNARVASLVTINAGVAVSVQKVNITIADVDAELELIVRLGHLVDIVNRVFQSLDLNPLLVTAINDLTNVVDAVVGEVDGLLGSITNGGNVLTFVIDNLGNIVQQVTSAAGGALGSVDTIVGNYLQNMTFTGVEQTLANGLVQKQYSYSPLKALVDIVFNTAGQVVQATVEKATGASSAASTAATAASGSKKRIRDL